VRILSFDVERERMSLSLLHADGTRIRPDEAAGLAALRERRSQGAPVPAATNLGRLLERALGQGDAARRPAAPERS